MNSEVRMLLEHRQNQDGQEDMELSDVFQKTLDYCKVNIYFLRRFKMAFILGVGSYSSDTRGPIWMKLWVCIELALKLCIVTFLTSG